MANTQQGSTARSQIPRRVWAEDEEEVLLVNLKHLVAEGWKSDNGFRPGYINKLEEAMNQAFPGCNIKGAPHIISKLSMWKKNYGSLISILSRSGVGFNVNGDYRVDASNAQWEEICRVDANGSNIRKKGWPLFEGWKEVFGKDRATGENAEDVMDALNHLLQEQNVSEPTNLGGDYVVDLSDLPDAVDAEEDSACQSSKRTSQTPNKSRKKRKTSDDSMKSICELLTEIHRDTNARLESLARKIGYKADLGMARKDVFELLSNIPGLSLDDQFTASEILVDKPERLEFFMGLPEVARAPYVARMIKGKGP